MLTEDDTEMFIIFISPLTFLQFHANNEDKIKEMPWGREGVPHTHCLCARNHLVIFLMKASLITQFILLPMHVCVSLCRH